MGLLHKKVTKTTTTLDDRVKISIIKDLSEDNFSVLSEEKEIIGLTMDLPVVKEEVVLSLDNGLFYHY